MEIGENKPIVLWCHPRSTSTAFERAFMERKADFKCHHEPFSSSFYFGPERLSTRYGAHELPHDNRRCSTIQDVVATLANHDNQNPSPHCRGGRRRRPFVKDMAMHVVSPIDGSVLLPREFLHRVTHTFLIRTPAKAIPSLYRMCTGDSATATSWRYFDPREAGYHEQRILFDHLRASGCEVPIVVDSDRLLQEPASLMRAYCEAVGVEFQEEMIKWEAGPVAEFRTWPGFHDDVERSSGIGEVEAAHVLEEEMPEIVLDCIDRNLADYDYLKAFELRAIKSHS